jgi:outer membrane protein assembly factor BamB
MTGRRHILIDRVRWQLAVGIGVLCGFESGLIVDSPNQCVGFQSASADGVVDAKDSDADKDDSALNQSAVPLRNRDLQERLRRAEAMIGRSDFAAAISEIREATQGTPGSLILTSESAEVWQQYRDSYSVVERLLRSLPAGEQALYLRQTEPLARSRFLKAVRNADVEDLRRLTLQFPLTHAASDALQFLTAWHLDRREFATAEAAARRLMRSPGLSQKQRDAAFRTIDLCAVYAGEQRAGARQVDAASETRSSDSSGSPPVARVNPDFLELPLRAKLFPFLTHPDWQLNSDLSDETATLARHALHEHFEQSIPILPRARPLVVDGIVVRRSLIQVSAHDLESGRLLWSDESESDAGQSASRLTMNLSLQELMAQKLARGLQVDSLQSRLSCDGERVFTVESGAGVMVDRLPARVGLLIDSNYQSQNRIVARELRTGTVTWNVTADAMLDAITTEQGVASGEGSRAPGDTSAGRVRGSDRVLDREDSLSSAEVFFCGLPTSVDRHVLGLVQVGELLWLYAADRSSGRVDWILDIAEAARQSPSDTDWRSLDCQVTLVDGVLVCPTGAGLLVGVDLATRSVIWSRRYSRADMPLEVTRLPFAPARPQRPWWRGWRDITLLPVVKHISAAVGDEPATPETKLATSITESHLIAASPDAEGFCSIDPRTGQLVWRQRVEAPVELIVDEHRIVVLSRYSVSAFNVASGTAVWKVACREPVGTGYRISVTTGSDNQRPSKFYVFPVRGGSLVAVNIDDGTILENVDRLESLSGCLVAAGDHVISMNPDRLSVWSLLSALPARRRATTEPAPQDVATAALRVEIDQAAFERSSGLFERSAARLREAPDSALANRDLRKTLLAWLEAGSLSAKQVSAVESELEQLVGEKSIADLISIRHAAARAAALSRDPLSALNFYAKLQSLNPSGEPRFLKPERLRSVRHDRLIQGEVVDLFNDCEEPAARSLRGVFDELARTAAASRDPFALQRFTRQWHDLPIAAKHVLDDRSRIGLRYGQKQLALLALADSDDRQTSAEASRKLIELFESRSYTRDAIAVRQGQLRKQRLPQGEVEAGEISQAGFGISPWNAGPVTVSEHAEQNLDTTFIPVPVECQPGSLFDRLNVAINPRSSRNDTILRFYGDGISGSWQTVLATSSSPLKSVGRMYRGWGIGHFLVLQLGAELFGVSPFDGSGEPRVQRLWSVDMADGSRQEDHQYAPAVPGFAEEELTMLDAFGRPIANVGPVRASYLCYQTRGKLVCLDTATGQRLWQRYELPRQAVCIGDGENVFMIQPGGGVVTVLRVVDGATVSTFQMSDGLGFRGSVLRASGEQILVAERSADSGRHPDLLRVSKIATLNLQTATVEWSSDVDPESTVFAIGPNWIGILQASGELRIIDFESGREFKKFTVQRPDRIRAVNVSSDASSHVIALSDTAESAFLNGRGARNPSLTGQLVAIDAVSATLKWQRPVDRIRFLLDQPKNAPCLVLNYRRSRSSGTAAMESVLHVINRETGEDILNRRNSSSASAFTFEPHADQHRLSIRMARKSIRLTFAPSQAP